MNPIYILLGAALLGIGFYGIIEHKNFIKKIISFNIFTTGIFILFVSVSMRDSQNDPVAVALVLTGLVVALASTTLALIIARSLHKAEDE